MSFFMLAVLGLALARLFELTVIHGQENRLRADQNRILIRPLPAPRGVILDRNDISLTRNIPSIREIDLPGDGLGPIEIEQAARSYPFGPALAHAVGYVGEVSQEELDECQKSRLTSAKISSDQTADKSDKSDKSDSGLSGLSIIRFSRSSRDSDFSENCPSPGEVIGKSGLEKQYDSLLRGTAGAQLIEIDANGKTLGILGDQPPIPGRNLKTTLDSRISPISLMGKKGAVVAIDPADGAILALVSSPSFDPNIFQNTDRSRIVGESDSQTAGDSEVKSSDYPDFRPARHRLSPKATAGGPSDHPTIRDLLTDTENLPLFNRAASGEYPPGSIFKLVTASAGLSENKINSLTLIEDTGQITVGEFRYGNWYFDQYGRTEGAINITRAIARSNDIFFYRVGEWLGPQTLADWARRLGLGQKTGVDLPAEADGLVPDPGWKERNIGEKWYLGNTYHMAIGQGDVRVTPLQVAEMTASVITGKKCRPHLYREGSDPSVSARGSDPSCHETGVSAENRNLILAGMIGACSTGGTAFPFFQWNEGLTFADAKVRPSVPIVACKTGTAQHGGAKTPPHAWISLAWPVILSGATAGSGVEGSSASDQNVNVDGSDPSSIYLDLDSPKRIILVVLVEESGEGSSVAAPLAKQILTEWFK